MHTSTPRNACYTLLCTYTCTCNKHTITNTHTHTLTSFLTHTLPETPISLCRLFSWQRGPPLQLANTCSAWMGYVHTVYVYTISTRLSELVSVAGQTRVHPKHNIIQGTTEGRGLGGACAFQALYLPTAFIGSGNFA